MFKVCVLCLQQNIRIMAKYYTRISMKRMANLLDLPIDVRTRIILGCCDLMNIMFFYPYAFILLFFWLMRLFFFVGEN